MALRRWRWPLSAAFLVGLAGGILATRYLFSERVAELDHRADSLALVVDVSRLHEAQLARADSATRGTADSLRGIVRLHRAHEVMLSREASRLGGLLAGLVKDTTAIVLLDSLNAVHAAELAEAHAQVAASDSLARTFENRWVLYRDSLVPELKRQRDALSALVAAYRAARVPRRPGRLSLGAHLGYGVTFAKGEAVTGPQMGLSGDYRLF